MREGESGDTEGNCLCLLGHPRSEHTMKHGDLKSTPTCVSSPTVRSSMREANANSGEQGGWHSEAEQELLRVLCLGAQCGAQVLAGGEGVLCPDRGVP